MYLVCISEGRYYVLAHTVRECKKEEGCHVVTMVTITHAWIHEEYEYLITQKNDVAMAKSVISTHSLGLTFLRFLRLPLDFFLFLFGFLVEFIELDELYTVSM